MDDGNGIEEEEIADEDNEDELEQMEVIAPLDLTVLVLFADK